MIKILYIYIYIYICVCVSVILHFEGSFSYAALFLWNQLDMSIRMLDFDHFKSRIKTELYLRYFEA